MGKAWLVAILFGIAAVVALPSAGFARNRMYHPTLGQFLQRDPAGTPLESPITARNVSDTRFTQRDAIAQYADGMHLYQYAVSSPSVGRDPLGLFTITHYTDCNEEQQAAIRQAAQAAETRLDTIISEFERFTTDYVLQYYVIAEGRQATSRQQDAQYSNYNREMLANFRQMKEMLNSGVGTKCECQCKEGVSGYVNALYGNTWAQIAYGDVHLCPPFFKKSVSEQAKTFFHEFSHRAANTRDNANSWMRPDGTLLTGSDGASSDAYHLQDYMNQKIEQTDKSKIWSRIWHAQ